MNTDTRIPQYRDDIKGNVKGIKDDCRDEYANEMVNGEGFPSADFREYTAYEHYSVYLTDNELQKLWKSAINLSNEVERSDP